MTPAALFLIAIAIAAGCGGSRSQHATEAATSDLPDVATYASKLDDKERYWWQRPEQVVALLECEPEMTVVDLGAGTGYFLPYLSEVVSTNGRVLALDVDRTAIEHLYRRVARERLYNVTPSLVTPQDPALNPRSTDRVLVVNTWHHLEDRVEYAKKLKPALRTGGLILVVDFEATSPKGPPIAHRLTATQVIEELQAAGFEATQVEETLPYQYAIVGRL